GGVGRRGSGAAGSGGGTGRSGSIDRDSQDARPRRKRPRRKRLGASSPGPRRSAACPPFPRRIDSPRMSIRVGIVGVSGYGGGEALRLCATHPTFEVVYVAGEGSAGQRLIERFPGVGKLG